MLLEEFFTCRIKLPHQLKNERGLCFINGFLSKPNIVKSNDGTNTSFIEIYRRPDISFLFIKSDIILTYNYSTKSWEEDEEFFVKL